MSPQYALESFTMLHAITIVSMLLLALFINQKWKKSIKKNLPPGPKPIPVIGNLHQLDRLPHFAKIYGPLMYLKLGSKPTIIISSSQVAREVFKNHDRIFSGRPNFYAWPKLTYGCSCVAFAPYGDYWRDLRKIEVTELLSPKRVQLFQKVRSEEVQLMVDSISQHSSSSNPVNLSEITILLSNHVVCRVAFGKLYESYKVDNLLHDVQALIAEFNISDFLPWMRWINKINGTDKRIDTTFKRLNDLFDKVIKDHQVVDPNNVRDFEDLVDGLLRVKNDPNQALALTYDQIKSALLLDIFVAGTDTSSSTIVWTMVELIRNPWVMKKAQEEVREAVKDKGKVEETDISQLVYLKAVIKETFRLRPPVPFLVARETTEACTLSGYYIPAQTRVLVDSKAMMIDPKSWERPNEYLPERFLDSQIDYKGQHFDYLPFGAGRRGCPGMNFGVMVVELALANLLYGFDWKLPAGTRIEDLDMEGTVGIAVHKKIPLCLVPTAVRKGKGV